MAFVVLIALSLCVAPRVDASQPGAVSPVPAPMRDLQWGQLNILHTTDIHGWYGGHLQESQFSADWGDYISFTEHMRKKADYKGVDLLVIDTGDRVEGNGLYDASNPKGKYYYEIFKEQELDILCVGNHELYSATTADEEYRQTVPNFENAYIASNLDYLKPENGDWVPMAPRYRKFRTKHQDLSIVAFGFIFDFKGNANNTIVQPVEETVKEMWFQDAINEKPDLFLVVLHAGVHMEETKKIFTAIRKLSWHTPILFLGGHVHVRDATSFDAQSFAVGSGRYLETIGWASVDNIAKSRDVYEQASVQFNRRYIDHNRLGLSYHSGIDVANFTTDRGRKVSDMIAKARRELKLDHLHGCAPKYLWLSRAPYPSEDSLFSWVEVDLLPGIVVNDSRRDKPRLAYANTGAFRFDILQGNFTRDTVLTVSPFVNYFSFIPDVPYNIARLVIKLLNDEDPIMKNLRSRDLNILDFQASHIDDLDDYEFNRTECLGASTDCDDGKQRPINMSKSTDEPPLVKGYTTKDDIGRDGDDTVHVAIEFYPVPNCIESKIAFPSEGEPETVDIVFIDFIKPYILLALKFSGGDYEDSDVLPYMDGAFPDLMAGWVEDNWRINC